MNKWIETTGQAVADSRAPENDTSLQIINMWARILALEVDTQMVIGYNNPRLNFKQCKQLAKLRLRRIGPYPSKMEKIHKQADRDD